MKKINKALYRLLWRTFRFPRLFLVGSALYGITLQWR
jgi:hypothetical protein